MKKNVTVKDMKDALINMGYVGSMDGMKKAEIIALGQKVTDAILTVQKVRKAEAEHEAMKEEGEDLVVGMVNEAMKGDAVRGIRLQKALDYRNDADLEILDIVDACDTRDAFLTIYRKGGDVKKAYAHLLWLVKNEPLKYNPHPDFDTFLQKECEEGGMLEACAIKSNYANKLVRVYERVLIHVESRLLPYPVCEEIGSCARADWSVILDHFEEFEHANNRSARALLKELFPAKVKKAKKSAADEEGTRDTDEGTRDGRREDEVNPHMKDAERVYTFLIEKGASEEVMKSFDSLLEGLGIEA